MTLDQSLQIIDSKELGRGIVFPLPESGEVIKQNSLGSYESFASFLVRDNQGKFNVMITNASSKTLYLFPQMVSESEAREKYQNFSI